jgi:prepilin-type N-terminal cleavage/methylation domain-containing protein
MNQNRSKRGMTLVEVTVSLMVLGVALMALLQLVSLAGRQRRALAVRRVALQEVANQAERIALLPWSETAPDMLTSWQPSAELAEVLPGAQCAVSVTAEEGAPQARRIRLEVAWSNAAAQPVEPVELTIWRLGPEAAP